MLKYRGKITPKARELLKESIIILKWDVTSLEELIFNKVCPNCHIKLLYADRWYKYQQCVVFKRLCPRCRKSFVLIGEFNNEYNKAKEYFIDQFRLNEHNRTI